MRLFTCVAMMSLLSSFRTVTACAEEINAQGLNSYFPDWSELVAIACLVVAIVSAFFAWRVWRTAEKSLRSQMLAELLRDYEKPVMAKHIQKLWDFWRDSNKDTNKVHSEFLGHLKLTNNEAEEINRARRPVSHFYQRMAVLHKDKMVQDKLLYHLWSEKDLLIIPEIIIPLEKALVKWRGDPLDEKDYELLKTLYEDGKKVWEKAVRNTTW